MSIRIDIMSTAHGHKSLECETMQEVKEKLVGKEVDLYNKLQNGWILSAEMSDGSTQMVANSYTKQGQVSKILRQLNPTRLLLNPPITAG